MKSMRYLLAEAARIIREGGVVIYPTETVYGIGCDPFNEKAVERIMELKKREGKPHPILCSSLDDVYRVARPMEEELWLASILWPGPVTIVMEKTPDLPEIVTSSLPNVGVRIPANLIVLELIRMAGTPIVGTSANISGGMSPASLDMVPKSLREGADMVIDGGVTYYGEPSTVVRLAGGGVRVVREGVVKKAELAKILLSRGYGTLED
jgi:L-threonylcarbamoyladenylate synthase